MKLNTERLHTIWHLTWPQGIMLLCQFVIGITDVWAGGRIGAEVQASIGLITQCHMMFMALAMAAVNGAVASISQSLGAGQEVRARRYVGLVVLGCIGIGAIIAAAASFWRVGSSRRPRASSPPPSCSSPPPSGGCPASTP